MATTGQGVSPTASCTKDGKNVLPTGAERGQGSQRTTAEAWTQRHQ